jgi:uncharacterized YccA/Bax inhibitor family protein
MSNYLIKKVSENIDEKGYAAMEESDTLSINANTKSTVTLDGVIVKSFGLFALLLISSYLGWQTPITLVALAGIFISFITILVLAFKPLLGNVLAPIYSLAMGYSLGYISLYFNSTYPGIVINAVSVTFVIFATFLFLYISRIVRVTSKMRSIVLVATLGVGIFYLVNFLYSLITKNTLPLIWDNSLAGILFSLAVSALASYNLFIDFDNIERAIEIKADSKYEWALSAGLLATLVWVYIEILRLLSKLRSR